MPKGLIHVYTGNGKGKTTAAVGIAIRAKGRGLRAMFIQFFKENDTGGEIQVLQSLGVQTLIFDSVKSPFFNPKLDKASIRREALRALADIQQIFEKEEFDLVVLDEFICLISESVLSEDEAIAFLKRKPARLELILTGAGATDKILSLADYVTLMNSIKHPYNKKLNARPGIEF